MLRLQIRIAKAIQEGKYGKAKALQWVLTHSKAAKLLAIRRVSQNKGSKTPGIDGDIWDTDARRMASVSLLSRKGYRAIPLRRIYISKKNGKLRFLPNVTYSCRTGKANYAHHIKATCIFKLIQYKPIAKSDY